MPLPIAHGLLGATAAAAVHPAARPGQSWKPLLWAAALGIAPDLDFVGLWLFELPNAHRTLTHSLPFTLLIAAILFSWHGRRNWRKAAAYTIALSLHWVADIATTYETEGVQLLWPFSTTGYKLGLFSLLEFRDGFEALQSLGEYLPQILKVGAIELGIFLPIFLFVYFRAWRPIRRPDPKRNGSVVADDEIARPAVPKAYDRVVHPADEPASNEA